MSSLGIKFVLPYTGSNGIVVNGNVISIDENAFVTVGRLNSKGVINANSERLNTTGLFVSNILNSSYIACINNSGETDFLVLDNGAIRTGENNDTIIFTRLEPNPLGFLNAVINEIDSIDLALKP